MLHIGLLENLDDFLNRWIHEFTEANKTAPNQHSGSGVLKPDNFAAWVCIIMFFMYFWNFVVMETWVNVLLNIVQKDTKNQGKYNTI